MVLSTFYQDTLRLQLIQYSSPSGFPPQVQEQSKVKSTKLPFSKKMNSFSHKTCPWPTLPKPAALISINLVDWKLKIWPHFTFGQVGYLPGAVKLTLKRQMHPQQPSTQNHPGPRIQDWSTAQNHPGLGNFAKKDSNFTLLQ